MGTLLFCISYQTRNSQYAAQKLVSPTSLRGERIRSRVGRAESTVAVMIPWQIDGPGCSSGTHQTHFGTGLFSPAALYDCAAMRL